MCKHLRLHTRVCEEHVVLVSCLCGHHNDPMGGSEGGEQNYVVFGSIAFMLWKNQA